MILLVKYRYSADEKACKMTSLLKYDLYYLDDSFFDEFN